MQEQIIPIDILERFENENDVSAAPLADLIYVFCPNTDISNNISSYSAYGMTVENLIQLYSDFCDWKIFNGVIEKMTAISGYYYNTLQPILLSSFPASADLTGVYMCRAHRTPNDFPYKIDNNSTDNKRTPLNPSEDYNNTRKIRGSKMMYHDWADFQTKQTDISTLAWLAPSTEQLSNTNAIAYDKYLEYRRQFIISLLQNRKRIIMAKTNLYAQALSVSREIRFDNKKYEAEYTPPALRLNEEVKIE